MSRRGSRKRGCVFAKGFLMVWAAEAWRRGVDVAGACLHYASCDEAVGLAFVALCVLTFIFLCRFALRSRPPHVVIGCAPERRPRGEGPAQDLDDGTDSLPASDAKTPTEISRTGGRRAASRSGLLAMAAMGIALVCKVESWKDQRWMRLFSLLVADTWRCSVDVAGAFRHYATCEAAVGFAFVALSALTCMFLCRFSLRGRPSHVVTGCAPERRPRGEGSAHDHHDSVGSSPASAAETPTEMSRAGGCRSAARRGLGRMTGLLLVIAMSIALLCMVEPWKESPRKFGRENGYQKLMSAIRCIVLPMVFVSHALHDRAPSPQSFPAHMVSIATSALWPRSRDVWSWVPILLMAACRSILGVIDVHTRINFFKVSTWEVCWRTWQHLDCTVSLAIGFAYFHTEEWPGRWRPLRESHGQPCQQLLRALPRCRALVFFVFAMGLDCVSDVWDKKWNLDEYLPSHGLVTGFWRQVLVALAVPGDAATWAFWAVPCTTMLLRHLHWERASAIGLSLIDGQIAYLVLCAQHRMSELLLMIVVFTESQAMQDRIRDFVRGYILRQMHLEMDQGAEWSTDADLLFTSAPDLVPEGAQLRAINGQEVFSKQESTGNAASLTLMLPPLPKGTEVAWREMHSEVKRRCGRLWLIVHFLFIERIMYFLSDFDQRRFSPTQMLARHLSYFAVGVWVLKSILDLNFIANRKLQGQILEAEVLPCVEHNEDLRQRLRTFRKRIMNGNGKLGFRIFTCLLTLRHMGSCVVGIAVYFKCSKKILGFLGLEPL